MSSRGDFIPKNAAEAYRTFTIEHLKTLAKFIGPVFPARKNELIDFLCQAMLNPGYLREYYEEQDEIGQAAIQEATHHPQGRLDLIQLEAKYGQRPLFLQKEETKIGEVAYIYGYHAQKPTKLRLFFPKMDALPLDIREKLLEFVPPPKRLEVATVKELPEKVSQIYLLRGGFWDREKPKLVTPRVRLTAASAQQEVKTMLRLAEAGTLRFSDKTQQPSLAATDTIAAMLTEGDYYQSEDADKNLDDPGGDLLMKPFAWSLLVQAAGWATVTSGKLRLTQAGGKALNTAPQELLRQAWEKWLKTTLLDEFSRIDIIRGQSKGSVLTNVAQRRQVIAGHLRQCPLGEWIPIDEFFRKVNAARELVLTRDPWHLYLFEQEYGSLGYEAAFPFETLEGRYILAFLFEYAATLGVIDIAYISPDGARNEYRDRWGADDLNCLSRYDGLMYFRINPLGAWLLGKAMEYQPEKMAEEKLFKVLPNRDIVAEQSLPPADALFLDRFAERQSPLVWQLAMDKILTAVAQGRTVPELVEFLQARSSVGLPETVTVFLQDLQHRATLLRDRGTARLIECADAHTAMLLAKDRKLKLLVNLAGETMLVFAATEEAAVKKALKELGYVLPPPG